jgi:hypothetical protein
MSATTPYAAGQVFTYRTRPGDEASRVKIQMVEHYASDGMSAEERVFHVSVARLAFRNPDVPGEIAHAPVSRETLDASLLDLAEPDPDLVFPDPAEGVAAWKEGEGGVFTFTLAELAQMYDDVTADFVAPSENLYFRTDWTHDRPGDPVWVMYEVDPDGRVLRTMHAFADGGGVLTSIEDFEDDAAELPRPGSLIEGNFYEIWKDVPFSEPHGDDGSGEHVVLTERDPLEFADLWRANRG